MRKTFQYKAAISKTTEAKCFKWLYLCRTLYNLCLEQRILCWNQWRKSFTAYDQKNELPELKKQFPEFKQVGSQVLQDVIERLDKAFKAFFRRLKLGETPGFPRFKGLDRYQSFTLKQAGWKLVGRNLYITGLGRFKLFLSRPIEGTIKTITIQHTSTGKWIVSFSCGDVTPKVFPAPVKEEIGIDVGIKSFLTDSEGNIVENPKFFKKSERELRKRQRKLSRAKAGSNRRKKAKHQVVKVHEYITNQRKDFAFKTALLYVTMYHSIYIEALQITNMVRNGHLSKAISNAAWGIFFNALSAKAAEATRTVVAVNPRNTSQLCSGCGMLVPKKLSVRIHVCLSCGLTLDRDENAARNIVQHGRAAREGVKLKPEFSLESHRL
jgi:putative transposase